MPTVPCFNFFKKQGKWHWELQALGRHGIIARSRSEGYSSESAAKDSTRRMLRAAIGAQGKFGEAEYEAIEAWIRDARKE